MGTGFESYENLKASFPARDVGPFHGTLDGYSFCESRVGASEFVILTSIPHLPSLKTRQTVRIQTRTGKYECPCPLVEQRTLLVLRVASKSCESLRSLSKLHHVTRFKIDSSRPSWHLALVQTIWCIRRGMMRASYKLAHTRNPTDVFGGGVTFD